MNVGWEKNLHRKLQQKQEDIWLQSCSKYFVKTKNSSKVWQDQNFLISVSDVFLFWAPMIKSYF